MSGQINKINALIICFDSWSIDQVFTKCDFMLERERKKNSRSVVTSYKNFEYFL